MTQCWRLDDARQTLALASIAGRMPHVIYWGAPLPKGEDLSVISAAYAIDVTGGMLDEHADLSICPEASRSFPGQPGLAVRDSDGTPVLACFTLLNVDLNGDEISISCSDSENGLTYQAQITLDRETHVIALASSIQSNRPIHLDWLAAPVLPAPQQSDEMIDIAGRWCGEFQLNATKWSPGIRLRESRTGRTGHEHFPGLLVPCQGASNTQGEAYAFHYGWSGGHRMIAEELSDGRRQIQFGNAAQTEPEAATAFHSAPLYAVYSSDGLNGCAVSFQRHVRDRIVTWPRPEKPRPVHYNCWEAVYFNHDLPVLKDIATRAADLGAERFVLDDGWFSTRDDDTSSLSDWTIDTRKYPDGFAPLIRHVHDLGMTFGLWFEPEMINPDSEIYRAHPEWALGPKDQILGRNQKVLDMALPQVRAFLFERISSILNDHDIDYIKWDHNRVLPSPDASQTRGSYALIDDLRQAFPDVEIESCASGGGRIDFGILSRTQRVWLSDSNDALERLRMQAAAALFLPAAITGSHVGPRVCHTSGRTLDIAFRAWVAAQRHLGFEMDPRELTPQETDVLKDVTRWWKENRSWMMAADILRLDSADPAVIAEQQTARDGQRFVVFAGKATSSTQISPRPLRLTRLDPQAMYHITLKNRASANRLSRGSQILKSQDIDVSGAYLMHHGITLPWSYPQSMWVIEGKQL